MKGGHLVDTKNLEWLYEIAYFFYYFKAHIQNKNLARPNHLHPMM